MPTKKKSDRSLLETVRNMHIESIRIILETHKFDIMDLSDCGSTPVIYPSSDDQDFDTYTLDRVYIDPKANEILVDSSSSDDNRTDCLSDLATDTLVDIVEFLTDEEDDIWQRDEDALKEQFLEEYRKQENCMGDFLASVTLGSALGDAAKSLTPEQAVTLYCSLLHDSDGDDFFRENAGDNERINLLSWDSEPLEKSVFVLQKFQNSSEACEASVVGVFPDREQARERLKTLRDAFLAGLGEDEDPDTLDTSAGGPDTFADDPDNFCYFRFEDNHLHRLEIVEAKV